MNGPAWLETLLARHESDTLDAIFVPPDGRFDTGPHASEVMRAQLAAYIGLDHYLQGWGI